VDALKREADLVFLALPDSIAAELAPALVEAGLRVIDLSGAFRLSDQAVRERWYPETRHLPSGLAYGLTEHERDSVRSARLVANPGCYPTTALMPLKPLAAAGLLVPGVDVIIDAKSGVSGAGKTPSERTHFSECHGSMSAYGVFGHRHAAEIEQGFGSPSRSRPTWRRSTAGFCDHLRPHAARHIRRGSGRRVRSRLQERALCSSGWPRRCPRSSTSPIPTICDIGWRVDPSGRVILIRSRQSLERRVGTGGSEHERDARTGRPTGLL
jgi:N-acetyl-gamma-glutamyl-phosphate reductase